MYCDAGFVPPSSLSSPYSLQSLTHLTFRLSCASFIRELFEIAEAPALFHIAFVQITHHPTELAVALSHIQNSGRFPSVRSIYLQGMFFAPLDDMYLVGVWLKCMPYCTILELRDDNDDNDGIVSNTLVMLVRTSLQGPDAIPEAGSALVPKLTALKLNLCQFRGGRFGWHMSLVAMLQQLVERRQSGHISPIQHLHVTTREPLPDYERKWFTQNVQDFSWGRYCDSVEQI